MTPKQMRRAAKKDNKRDVEAEAADARKKRQEACAKEYDKFLPELTKRHNCRPVFAVLFNGQWVPTEQVFHPNLQVTVGFTANIEGGVIDPKARP